MSRHKLWYTVAGLAAATLLLAVAFGQLDAEAVGTLVGDLGPLVLVVLAPFAVNIALDTAAWRGVLTTMGQRIRPLALLRVRAFSEAVLLTTPGGAVVSEALKPMLLGRVAGVPIATSVAAIVLRKWLIVSAHAASMVIGLLVASDLFVAASERVVGSGILVAIAVAATAGLVAAAASVPLLLSRGRMWQRLHAFLMTVSPRFVRERLERARQGFADLDDALASRLSDAATWRAAALYMAIALVEAAETLFIAHLAGVEMTFGQAVAIEAFTAVIRSAAFFVPAGLGFQDVGYMGFFVVLGAVDPVASGAAFSLLKRSKELAWAVVGYVLIPRSPRSVADAPRTSSPLCEPAHPEVT